MNWEQRVQPGQGTGGQNWSLRMREAPASLCIPQSCYTGPLGWLPQNTAPALLLGPLTVIFSPGFECILSLKLPFMYFSIYKVFGGLAG